MPTSLVGKTNNGQGSGIRDQGSATAHTSDPRLAGVTLMEMVVVVAIIAVIVGISVPAVSSGIDSVRLRSATDSTAAFLNAAVVRSERRQEPIELVVFPQENVLRLYSNEPGFTRELKMPDGITIEDVLPNEREEQGPRYLVLLPGGAVPGIGIQMANRHGSRRVVHLDPMTGFPRVEVVINR
jgi:prepilin-type N-terminal cleavage/methylation domain-containing protein